jgi:hypothetical protein
VGRSVANLSESERNAARKAGHRARAEVVARTKTGIPEISDPKIRARVEAQFAHVPNQYKGLYLKSILRPSPRLCIKVRCLDCSAWSLSEAQNCGAVACPLWCLRPGGQKSRPQTPPRMASPQPESEDSRENSDEVDL